MLLDQTFNRKYEVLEKVREGGMGSVYKVRHRLLDEVRIVKVICGQADGSSEAFDRFLSEARAAIRLRHPNVAVLYDFALSGDGKAFIVMEFIEGWNLKELLLGYGPPPLHLTLEIGRQALLALAYLHRRQIVHRDIAPDNLMMSRNDEGGLVLKLIDLGIAKNLAGSGALTATGLFLGKPRYGSPECLRGEGCDPRSDLYSFGVVLYELLTGHCPVVGHDAASQMAGHLFRPPLPFEETDPDDLVPRDLREIVLRTLAKVPGERFQTAEELALALAGVQERFPPHKAVFEDVWKVFRPLPPPRREVEADPERSSSRRGETPTPPRSGSRAASRGAIRIVRPEGATPGGGGGPVEATQSLLTPLTRSGRVGDETRRTGVPVAVGGPDLESDRRRPGSSLESAELDVTWARRPLRSGYFANASNAAYASDPSEATRERAVVVPLPLPADHPAVLPVPASRPAGGRLWIVLVAASLLAAMAVGATLLVRSRAQKPGEATGPTPIRQGSVLAGSVEAAAPAALHLADPGSGGAGGTTEIPSFPTYPLESEPAASKSAAPGRPPVRSAAPALPMRLGDMILASQPGIEGPEVRQLGMPPYPPAARGSGQTVIIRMRVLVDENGKVIDARIISTDRSGLGFDGAAQKAAYQTSFFPAHRDGIPGKMWADLDFEFRESSPRDP